MRTRLTSMHHHLTSVHQHPSFMPPLARTSPHQQPLHQYPRASVRRESALVSSLSKEDGAGAGVLSAAHERVIPAIASPGDSYKQRLLQDGGGSSAEVSALRGEVRVLSASVTELAGAMKEGQQGLLDAIAALGKRLDAQKQPAGAAAEE